MQENPREASLEIAGGGDGGGHEHDLLGTGGRPAFQEESRGDPNFASASLSPPHPSALPTVWHYRPRGGRATGALVAEISRTSPGMPGKTNISFYNVASFSPSLPSPRVHGTNFTPRLILFPTGSISNRRKESASESEPGLSSWPPLIGWI